MGIARWGAWIAPFAFARAGLAGLCGGGCGLLALWEEDWRGHGQGQLGLIQKLKRGGVVSGPLVG